MSWSRVWPLRGGIVYNARSKPGRMLAVQERRNDPPLCVDLDGTLLNSDLLVESLLLMLKRQPWTLFLLPWWLLRGKAHLKHEIAQCVEVDVSLLPYHPQVLPWVREEHQAGRQVVLATASHERYAQAIAAHLGCFDAVEASRPGRNLEGRHKAAALVARYGAQGFDYAGNSRADHPVWAQARQAIVVSPDARLLKAAQARHAVSRSFIGPAAGLRPWTKALRVQQWLKNLLIFLPLALAHRLGGVDTLAQVLLAFFCFSLCASSVYVLNDLLDLESDRRHPRKAKRPWASGQIPLVRGLLAIPLLLILCFGLALAYLPLLYVGVLALYYVMTLSYSIWLKSRVMVDVVMLAALYTMRLLAGMAVAQVAPSFWLLAFSLFIFFSLALVKRYSELYQLRQRGQLTTHGRGYHVEDLVMLLSFGVASGFIAVLVFALYINSAQVQLLYREPRILWLATPLLLYWISRIWVITHRGQMHDDPVVFAARDRHSWMVGLLMVVLMVWAAV